MHLRRALLLFAIVLGLAALATAVSRPPQRGGSPGESRAPRTSPRALPAPQGVKPVRVRIGPRARRRPRRLEARRPAEVVVAVPGPGQVELRGLGLNAPADPLTPARFDVLASAGGRVDVLFTRAGDARPRRLGVLSVAPAER